MILKNTLYSIFFFQARWKGETWSVHFNTLSSCVLLSANRRPTPVLTSSLAPKFTTNLVTAAEPVEVSILTVYAFPPFSVQAFHTCSKYVGPSTVQADSAEPCAVNLLIKHTFTNLSPAHWSVPDQTLADILG